MWFVGTKVTVRQLITALVACSVSCSNTTKKGCPICLILAFVLIGFGRSTFLQVFASGGQERRSLSKAAEGVPRPPRRPLRAVWSLREASYFGRWLIERDDEAGEALSPVLSYGFGLCSPADFAVSVKRLLGHHQSHSS
ncbi:E3 ubiquitin-protein ligase lubel [Dissostichus eleginoides]|uniref:E3 ubiquitin-protein ligase lubel n=1 Tax=Dissostichus eleginoides TaxID=100907 RepID=A0AAD9BVL4_DISEL|nr:E3 ubiquitin-protein ligase lubel [Dissostichus eleginoides]